MAADPSYGVAGTLLTLASADGVERGTPVSSIS